MYESFKKMFIVLLNFHLYNEQCKTRLALHLLI